MQALHNGVVSDETKALALNQRFLGQLRTITDAHFVAAYKQWDTAGTTIDDHENRLLRRLRLPKCI
jgi:hypothetical protein